MANFTFILILLIAVTAQIPAVNAETPQRPIISFEKFAEHNDTNNDGVITQDEFKGNPNLFKWIDRNRDGKITREEFISFGETQKLNRKRSAIPHETKVFNGIRYAEVDGNQLKADIYVPSVPAGSPPPPLLVWIHGGGWTKGSRRNMNGAFKQMLYKGYAVASIDYRLEGIIAHPKLIHDCKGAIRFLRANAKKFGYNADKIGVGGSSAGGHLVLLLGFSNGVPALEGTVGGNLEVSSKVDAIVDFYGPADFKQMKKRARTFGNPDSPIVASASPVTYLDPKDPPVLIFQGDKDALVPCDQSIYLDKVCKEKGVESHLNIIQGAQHGGKEFITDDVTKKIADFFDKHIKESSK